MILIILLSLTAARLVAQEPSPLPKSALEKSASRPGTVPSPSYKAELEKTIAARKARASQKSVNAQKRRQRDAEIQFRLAESAMIRQQEQTLAQARTQANSLAAQLAAQRVINEQLAQAERYARQRADLRSDEDRYRTNSPYDDPAWLAARRLEAAWIEAEITRLAQQAQQGQSPGTASIDSYRSQPGQGQSSNQGPSGGTASMPAPPAPTPTPAPSQSSSQPQHREVHVGATKTSGGHPH